jgi:hypothetical protein
MLTAAQFRALLEKATAGDAWHGSSAVGLLQQTVYHAGQIALLRKLVE